MQKIERELTDPISGFLRNATHLIHDGDPLFTDAFLSLIGSSGVKPVQIPPKSPNCNPHAERFVRSIRYECLNYFIPFGEQHLRQIIHQYMTHYLEERFHQGLDGQLIHDCRQAANSDTPINRRQRLGGILNYYHRDAA